MWCVKYVWFLLVTKPHRYWNYCGLLPISIFEGNTKFWLEIGEFNSVTQLCLTLQPHEPQHTRLPCLSPTLRVHPNSCPLSRWCHPAISSSVVPFSSYPQSFPASGSFQMSQLSTSGGQSIGVSASTSVPPMNTYYGGSKGKEYALQCSIARFNPWIGTISWRRKWQPTPVFLPGKSHGWRSLVGCSPWGRKE